MFGVFASSLRDFFRRLASSSVAVGTLSSVVGVDVAADWSISENVLLPDSLSSPSPGDIGKLRGSTASLSSSNGSVEGVFRCKSVGESESLTDLNS